VRRYGPAIAAAYTQEAWPQTVVLDAIEFSWTNPPALAARTDRRLLWFSVRYVARGRGLWLPRGERLPWLRRPAWIERDQAGMGVPHAGL